MLSSIVYREIQLASSFDSVNEFISFHKLIREFIPAKLQLEYGNTETRCHEYVYNARKTIKYIL